MARISAGLTAAFVLIIAVVMSLVSDAGSRVSGVFFGEALFAAPMIIAYLLMRWIVSDDAHRVILVFQFGFFVFVSVIFYLTFTGDHDAQYQLALLLIPLFGFPSVAIAGVIAACHR